MGQIKIPRITTSQRTGGSGLTLAAGELVYDTDTGYIYKGDGSTAGGVLIEGVSGNTFATDLKIGRDADNLVDFTTDNNIVIRANGEDQLTLVDGALTPSSNAILDLGTDALEFKDAYFDGTLEADAITIGGTAIASVLSPVAGHASIATVGTIGTGVWQGTAIATAYIADDAITEDKLANTLLAEIDANTAKATNVSTNLSVTTSTTTVRVDSSDGTNATIPVATTSVGGVMSKAIFDEHTANNAKNTNVSTALSAGTVNATTYGITSDGGTDDIVLPEATTSVAGLLGAAKWDEIVANTAKTSFSNLTGDVTSSGAATTIADNAVTLAKMAGIDAGHIIYGDASGNPASLAEGSDGDVLTLASGLPSWAAAGGGSGDITSVVAGAGMTGGATSGDATLNVIGGDGITANADDIAVTAAQTAVTSMINASLTKIGTATDQEYVTFGTANEVNTFVNNTERHSVTASGVDITGALSVSGDVTGNRKYELPGTTAGDNSGGDIYYYGDGSTVKGSIYYIDGTNWTLADADAAVSSTSLLAVALGIDPDVDGMLLRGFVTLLTEVEGTEAIGSVLYLSATDAGIATSTAPGSGDILRVIGHSLHATNNQVYFNPSNDFMVIA